MEQKSVVPSHSERHQVVGVESIEWVACVDMPLEMLLGHFHFELFLYEFLLGFIV